MPPNVLVFSVSGDIGPMAADRGGGDDAELVGAVLRGQLSAFDVLVERYQRQATAVAYRLLNNRDDAMEVVQDAFLRAYEKLDSLSHPERFAGWFMRTVSNLALNRRRSRALRRGASLEELAEAGEGRGGLVPPDPRASSPEEVAAAGDLRRLIGEGIDELPEMQRQALVLFSIAKLPQKEVASLLGCSVEAVKWHVFTARKKLKDKLKDYL